MSEAEKERPPKAAAVPLKRANSLPCSEAAVRERLDENALPWQARRSRQARAAKDEESRDRRDKESRAPECPAFVL